MLRRLVPPQLVLALLLLVTAAGCEQATVATPAPQTITISGSTAMQPVLQALAEEFTRQHPNVLFDLRPGGSTLGEERLLRDEIDLAASTLLPPGETEPDDQEQALVRTPIGIDGVAVVVHPGNPVAALSYGELRDIFSGHLLDWSDVGGDAGAFVLVSREEGSGARILFEERVMGNDNVSLTAVVMPSSADVADFVATHPQAIGYVSIAYADGVPPAGPPPAADAGDESTPDVKILALNDLMPDADALLSQAYPLVQPLYLIAVGEPSGWTRQFIDFTLGPTGQEIVGRYHVPIR